VAARRDLWGWTQLQIRDSLDLRDVSSAAAGDGSRSARRYVSLGRKQLAQVGAWPWCIARGGVLPPRWWTDREYAERLAAWWYVAWCEDYNDLLGTADRLAGDDSNQRVSGDRLQQARRVCVERLLQRGPSAG